MASSTGHVEMWTRVHILTCSVELATGHRPNPIKKMRKDVKFKSKILLDMESQLTKSNQISMH